MSAIESFQLYLSSESADKISVEGSNAEFYLPVIEIPSQYHIHLYVINASIPFTFYNVNSYNNILNYRVSGVDFSLYITQGNYTITTMVTFLKSNMSGFVIGYDATTNKFTFSHSTYSFSFLSTSTALELLGFTNQTQSSIGLTLTSNKTVNLSPIRTIYISTNLNTSNISKIENNSNNILCSIPIQTQPHSIITYTNPTNFKVNTYTNHISTVVIKLTDQNGRLLNLNGGNWAITLQFDIIDFVDDEPVH